QKYPWGDDEKIDAWPFGRVGEPAYDRTRTDPPVFGLYSNVAEWTCSWFQLYPVANPAQRARFLAPEMPEAFVGTRVVRGGPSVVARGELAVPPKNDDVRWEPRYRHANPRDLAHRGLGFRCARSERPRFLNP